jgi:DNA gyrase subunit A
MISMKLSDRNGAVVGAIQVESGDEVILISDRGTLVRTRTDEVSVQGRNTQGVKLINVQPGEKLVGLARVQDPDDSADAEIVDDLEPPTAPAPSADPGDS